MCFYRLCGYAVEFVKVEVEAVKNSFYIICCK